MGVEGAAAARVAVTPMALTPLGRRKKKDGFLSKIQIPEFGGKKGHTYDVVGAFRQWAHCITYYRDYYEDSYLMPLVVSSLMGDTSDVFNWILSLNPGNTQDLTTLLQMLREHYCGSLTFREQRNTIENLRQKPQEAAIDFLIRVGTSMSNLGKDWKDDLTDKEHQSLQYEVSLNGVHEEIRHILDSKIAKNGGKLTPLKEQAEQALSLLKEYHDIFSLEKRDMGHTNATKHKIVLKDPDTPPFKERFRRIPPPQLDEVREHLKLMLDAGVIWPSNSPWCNAVVLVRKKDGSLYFCIDFRKLNSLTIKDSHPLPHICETLESLTGAAHFTTFDMNSGFWQVPMDEESKQYTAFTLGSMGLYECESMPFGLCNAPPTFQRLMQNCPGELNLTYCLIYLDDVIVFSDMPEEHLRRMCVVFDCLHEHGLKLKPSKCEVFKSEINYLAHHVSQKGVLPSKKNLESIAQCPPPDTYTKVKSFVGLVGHYRCFIKGFAKIAAPLYDLTSGNNKDKKSEHVDLSPKLVKPSIA